VAVAILLWSLGGQQVKPTVTEANSAPGTQSERKFYGSMTEEEKLRFISEAEQQISAMMGDRHVKLSDEAVVAIKTKVDRYFSRASSSSSEPGAEQLKDIYGRAPRYIPSIARAFAARKVPIAIGIYLPMIEAEYRPCFENEIGAKGLFQFLPSTAQQYGVPAGEMCNEQKMTPAAAHYLADRMAELGEDSQSLTLVLLSYNRGPEWVRDTLRDLRNTENFQRNFWTMFAHRNELDETFRRENAGYVPMFFAAAIIGENPDVFGLETPPLSSLAGEVRSL
jgi:hypothetical protein